MFRKDILYEFVHKTFVVQAGYNSVQHEPFEFFFTDGLFLTVVQPVFPALALIIVFAAAALAGIAVRDDGHTAVTAYHFVAEQIDGLDAPFAALVLLHDGAHPFKEFV